MSVRSSTQHRWFTSYVQSLMTTILDEPVEVDRDGDIPLHGQTAQAWVRVSAAEPWGVQVFALAAQRARQGRPAPRAQRDQRQRPSRSPCTSPGSVMVDYRLFADVVTLDTLGDVITRVLAVADRIGPMLTAVHSGSTPIEVEPSTSDR